jgi:anaerobic selenocysteine-containing dehydrogenase
MAERVRTTCNRDCPDSCGIVATVEDGRVVQLQGDREHPVTQGFLCYRTNQFLRTQYAPERVTRPLLRREKTGPLEAVSWDEALAAVAAKLEQVKAESGPAAILHYRSGGSLGFLKAVTDLFFERFGPCATKRGDICSGAGEAAQLRDFGTCDSNDLSDLENARTIVLWGKNVYTSSPHTIPVLKRAQKKGARIIGVDPVVHRSAGLCERFLQPRPGGDFALALAVARLLDERGDLHADAGRWCSNLDEHLTLVRSKTLAEWTALADVTADDVALLADALAPDAGPCTILVGWGMQRTRWGAAIVRALDALGAITGNVGVPGAGVSFYWWRRRAGDFSFLDADAAPRTVCEPTLGEDLLAASAPPYRFVWVTAGNPVAMLPGAETTARALRGMDMTVVVDHQLTDTARCADVVLPVATLLEDDDVIGAYGHHLIGVSRPVVPPAGEAKTDLEIVQALAALVGLEDAVAGDARAWKRRIMEPKLKPHGVTLEDLERGPVRSPVAPRIAFEGRRFDTDDGRARLVTLADDIPLEPVVADDERPLFLLSLSTPEAQSSQWAKPLEGPAVATVHPDAAAGVADGGRAWLSSASGEMHVVVRHDARQRRDVVIVPKGGHLAAGRCANALIAPRLTDLGEGGALHDERVRLTPV